jgi:hypothetical protein
VYTAIVTFSSPSALNELLVNFNDLVAPGCTNPGDASCAPAVDVPADYTGMFNWTKHVVEMVGPVQVSGAGRAMEVGLGGYPYISSDVRKSVYPNNCWPLSPFTICTLANGEAHVIRICDASCFLRWDKRLRNHRDGCTATL